jgi:hypothetical protein
VFGNVSPQLCPSTDFINAIKEVSGDEKGDHIELLTLGAVNNNNKGLTAMGATTVLTITIEVQSQSQQCLTACFGLDLDGFF